MAYRSWLKDVKKVNDLGTHMHSLRFRDDDFEAREPLYEQKWLDRLRQEIPVAEADKRYFGSCMHDSWVRSIRREGSDLVLSLHSIYTDIFAIGLAEALDIPQPPGIWRVDLVCHGVEYVNAARHDQEGNLRWADWQHYVAPEDPLQGDQFLVDWFFTEDGRIQWIADLWTWRKIHSKQSCSMYLLVDCTSVSAKDLCVPAISKAFSPAAGALWAKAWKKRAPR